MNLTDLPTRDELAYQVYERAFKRIRALEAEASIAFTDLANAREAMLKLGIETHLKLSEPIEAAWITWQAKGTAADTMAPTSLRA